jgi:hypothetical protein
LHIKYISIFRRLLVYEPMIVWMGWGKAWRHQRCNQKTEIYIMSTIVCLVVLVVLDIVTVFYQKKNKMARRHAPFLWRHAPYDKKKLAPCIADVPGYLYWRDLSILNIFTITLQKKKKEFSSYYILNIFQFFGDYSSLNRCATLTPEFVCYRNAHWSIY